MTPFRLQSYQWALRNVKRRRVNDRVWKIFYGPDEVWSGGSPKSAGSDVSATYGLDSLI